MSNELSTVDQLPSATAATTEIGASRAAQQVQAQMIVAQKFPRDENQSLERMLTACKRKTLADIAVYRYPRGNTTVIGPSIRLAEVMAQNWGNMEYGIVELEQKDGESTVEAFCWDMETNVRRVMQYTVPHIRESRDQNGNLVQTRLTSARDIYETVANMGARRVRACILGVIPQDIKDACMEQVTATKTGDSKEPIEDRVRKMVMKFKDLGVSIAMIEAYLQHPLAAIDIHALSTLIDIYNSLKDGIGSREDWFNPNAGNKKQAGSSKTEQAEADVEKKKTEKKKTTSQKKKRTTKKPEPEQKPEPAEPEPEAEAENAAVELSNRVHDLLNTHASWKESIDEYVNALCDAKDEGGVRMAWTEHVFDKQGEMPPELYGAACELRDVYVRSKNQ